MRVKYCQNGQSSLNLAKFVDLKFPILQIPNIGLIPDETQIEIEDSNEHKANIDHRLAKEGVLECYRACRSEECKKGGLDSQKELTFTPEKRIPMDYLSC
ncbi:MAG: hypothetical protein U1F40_14780 [Turneriella sp.]